jgi:hypothetical protein
MSAATHLRICGLLAAVILVSACQDEAPAGEVVEVPSGREVSLIDIVTNARGPEGATARFRFLAPGLTPDEVEAAAVDMQAVCDSFAIDRIDGMVPAPQQIVITFASEAVPFGENGACVWEVF